MNKVRTTLYIFIILTCLAGFVFPNSHPHFWWQKIPVFDAVFAFLGSIVLILLAKKIGLRWLIRSEDYYD